MEKTGQIFCPVDSTKVTLTSRSGNLREGKGGQSSPEHDGQGLSINLQGKECEPWGSTFKGEGRWSQSHECEPGACC